MPRSVIRLGVVLSAIACATVAQAVSYNVTDLGSLGGNSYAQSINNNGLIVGYSYVDAAKTDYRAFTYSLGSPGMQDITPTAHSATLNCVNDNGVAVGSSDAKTRIFACNAATGQTNWEYTSMTAPTDLMGVDSAGRAVGYRTGTYNFQSVCFGWDYNNGSPNSWMFTGPAGARTYDYAQFFGINDSGRIVMTHRTDYLDYQVSLSHALLFDPSVPTLVTFATGLGGQNSAAYAVNESDWIVGQAELADGSSHAYLYNGNNVDLHTLGGTTSIARSINDSGLIVGDSTTAAGATHAFLSDGTTMTDLNSLIGPDSGWTLTSATSINELGWVVGYGTNSLGQEHAFVLTPLPEPSTIAMLAVGFVGLLAWYRRRNSKACLR